MGTSRETNLSGIQESFLEVDFIELNSYLATKNLVPTIFSDSHSVKLKKVHLGAFALVYWDFNLQDLPEHASIHLKEARSDAIASIPLAMEGKRKQAFLSLREVSEDVLRHVYYSEHSVEYRWLQTLGKYMTWKDLLAYTSNRLFYLDQRLGDSIKGSLGDLYQETSSYVHSRTMNNMQLSACLV